MTKEAVFTMTLEPGLREKTRPMEQFDFAGLQTEIEQAARQAVDDMARRLPDETICAFALYTDGGAMTVCPATETLGHLRQAQHDAPGEEDFHRFCSTEWRFEGDGAEDAFERICTRVRTEVLSREGDDAGFDDFKRQLCETCVRALESLRVEGVFDRLGPDFLLMFGVADDDVPVELARAWVARLNSPSVVAAFHAWTLTWSEE
jgi:hypothetical protein